MVPVGFRDEASSPDDSFLFSLLDRLVIVRKWDGLALPTEDSTTISRIGDREPVARQDTRDGGCPGGDHVVLKLTNGGISFGARAMDHLPPLEHPLQHQHALHLCMLRLLLGRPVRGPWIKPTFALGRLRLEELVDPEIRSAANYEGKLTLALGGMLEGTHRRKPSANAAPYLPA